MQCTLIRCGSSTGWRVESGGSGKVHVDVNVNCTKEDMKRFLNKAITVVPNFDGEMASDQPTDEKVCA